MNSQDPPPNAGPAQDEELVILRPMPAKKARKKRKKGKRSKKIDSMTKKKRHPGGNQGGQAKAKVAPVKGLRSFQFLLVNACLELSASWLQSKHLEMIEEVSAQDAYAAVGEESGENDDENGGAEDDDALARHQGHATEAHDAPLGSPREMSAHLSMANVTLRYIQYALELVKQ